MRIVKFIIIVILIVGICFGVPCFWQNNININDYYSKGENANTIGPMGYYGLIVENENADNAIIDNSINMMKDYGNALKGQNKEYSQLLFTVELLLGIFIISIGIILLKLTTKKYVSYAFIVSGTISIIGYILLLLLSIN